MSLVCSVAGHKSNGTSFWNRGYHFSSCARCKADLVESEDDRWITPPPGYRVVRKPPEPDPTPPPAWSVSQDAPPPASLRDEVSEPAPASPLQEKRARTERRVDTGGELPASLGGIERRKGEERRKPDGQFRANRRKGLLAQ